MIRYETVSHGKDSEIVAILLSLHAVSDPLILDCTYNSGKMWRRSEYKPIRMDINSVFELDVVADFTAMPFADTSFDVIVFDPPFLPTHAASAKSSKIWELQYGITANIPLRGGDNVCPMFKPFLLEARRVLKPEGIVIAKIGDLVHNHRQQFQGVEFINCTREVGLCPCDLLIKVRTSNLNSSKWKSVRHLRKTHSYFFVVRKGGCERK
jgi:hypothetical protein